ALREIVGSEAEPPGRGAHRRARFLAQLALAVQSFGRVPDTDACGPRHVANGGRFAHVPPTGAPSHGPLLSSTENLFLQRNRLASSRQKCSSEALASRDPIEFDRGWPLRGIDEQKREVRPCDRTKSSRCGVRVDARHWAGSPCPTGSAQRSWRARASMP